MESSHHFWKKIVTSSSFPRKKTSSLLLTPNITFSSVWLKEFLKLMKEKRKIEKFHNNSNQTILQSSTKKINPETSLFSSEFTMKSLPNSTAQPIICRKWGNNWRTYPFSEKILKKSSISTDLLTRFINS